MSCEHLEFTANAEFIRLLPDDGTTDPYAFLCELRVSCAQCNAPFGFRGLPTGSSPASPTRSLDALELRAPLLTPAELALNGPLPGLAEDPPSSGPGYSIEVR